MAGNNVPAPGAIPEDYFSGGAHIATGELRCLLDAPSLPVFSNATRPLANTVPVGTEIYNTSDNAPNYSDGTDWRTAAGVITS